VWAIDDDRPIHRSTERAVVGLSGNGIRGIGVEFA
jgi:hypothetical protein